jgi:hypothetical protein
LFCIRVSGKTQNQYLDYLDEKERLRITTKK